jgi:nucleoside-diphosphate-sugar epimerase
VLGDLKDEAAIAEAVRGATYVFHIAAVFREAKFQDSEYFDVNAGGTQRILRAAKRSGVKRVIHCSTNGVHGGSYEGAVNEDAPFAPADVYQESKCEAERVALKESADGSIECVIIRPGMIWGEGDRRFLKMFRGIARRRLPIIGSGQTVTHWTYVKDLVESFLLAAITPAANRRAYLIAGREPVVLSHVYQTIAQLAGVSVVPVRVPAWPLQLLGSVIERVVRPFGIEPPLHRRRVDFYVKNRCFDISRARSELGFLPTCSFEEEAERIFRWYQREGWL